MIDPKGGNIFLGFDFYGAGNIGDDLMLEGFLESIRNHGGVHSAPKLGCMIPHDVESQKVRFSGIDWYRSDSYSREQIQCKFQYWIGMGGTVFQMTAGSWILDAIQKDTEVAADCGMPMYMIGVGGEAEAMSARNKIEQIIKNMKHICTRDQFSGDLLTDNFPSFRERISVGADLANVALSKMFETIDVSPRKFDLAVNYFAERSSNGELAQVKQFLVDIAKHAPVSFFCNETRRGMGAEYDLYRSMFLGLKNIFARPPVNCHLPDYRAGSLYDLVAHFKQYKVVMSSRYHSLLTAAWAGCKVAALGRSSKITALARELDIPLLERPLSYSKLESGFNCAKAVPRSVLVGLASRAGASVSSVLNRLND